MEIGFAALQDAGELLAIYSQYMETPITFECAPPAEEEFTERIRNISACYPYLVCRENGRIIGYAYAHRQAERAAYQWNAELSIYLDRGARGRGLGRRVVAEAEQWARELGFETAVLESRDVAVGFYEKLGYTADRSRVIHGGTFPCIPMEKPL